MCVVDNLILNMRIKDNSYLKTIIAEVLKYEPYCMLDELVVLKHILNILDSKKLPYSRKEIRKVVNLYYNKEYHEEKVSYLNFLSKNCSKKVVFVKKLNNPSKIPLVSKNSAVAVTPEGINPHYAHKKEGYVLRLTQTISNKENTQKTSISEPTSERQECLK